MSVITSIRDYIEIINTQIGAGDNPVPLFSVVSETFPYILKICKDSLWSFVSFKSLRDNLYQPYLSSINTNFTTTFIDSIVSWTSNEGALPLPNLRFLVNGLGNSFFISLPGSVGTLLILRRIILQGVPAGLSATIGGVLGSCFIMTVITFGNHSLVLSPAFLDLLFFIGLLIPSYVILRGLCFSDFRIIPAKDSRALISIGFIHFLLGMSNQSTLFKHLRDLTIVPEPTRFLGVSDNISGIFYILGFSIGSIIFTFSAFYGVVFFTNWCITRSTMTRSRLMKWFENLSIVFLTGLSISTFSYYGTDFLLTKSLGFLPSDKGLSETVLVPNSIFKDPHNLTGVHALYPSNEFSLDPAPFDRPLNKFFRRSILLKQPGFKYRSFEELNYQGEKHWLHRGFRHGSAKPIKTVTLSTEKNKLSEGRALLRSLDKAIGWIGESENKQTKPELAFTNLAKEDILFDFESSQLKNNAKSSAVSSALHFEPSDSSSAIGLDLPSIKRGNTRTTQTDLFNNLGFLEQKFKRIFFGQIGLLPGRLPPIPYGPLDSQEMAHKRLAYTNPVYKALLSLDIDLFLKRQPSTQSLTASDEHNIFLKRQLLERYINTQRDYFYDQVSLDKAKGFGLLPSILITDRSSKPLANELFIKSLANQTYKHQFKGTLEIVRQMFAVSLDCPEPSSVAGGGPWDKALSINEVGKNSFQDDKGLVTPRPINPRVLKFDQPLYTLKSSGSQNKNDSQAFALDKLNQNPLLFLKSSPTEQLKTLLSSTKTLKGVEPFGHEELYKVITQGSSGLTAQAQVPASKIEEQKQKPFLESASMSPFYVGWDNDRRQLLLTRRYLSRKNALVFKQQTFTETNQKDRSGPKAQNPLKTYPLQGENNNFETSFVTWPIVKPDLTDKLTTNWRIPSRSFEQMVALEEEARMGLDEPSDQNKGLRGSYDTFIELWNNHFLKDLTQQQIPAYKLSRWPSNITTPSVQTDLDSFDQIESSLFTSVKRGGFIWPGSSNLKDLK